MSILEEPIN